MGVKDLFNFVKDSLRPANLDEFRGARIAVDVSSWLHRGVFSCVEDVAQGKPTTAFLGYPLKMLRALRSFDVHVVLVFDGQRLPAKAATNDARKERRDVNRELGLRLLREGDVAKARACLIQTTAVDHSMVRALIKAVRGIKGVDVVMAPFEADAQLTHLQVSGLVDLVVTEDSDLIPFGCTKILFKLDESGNGTLFEQHKLYKSLVSDPAKFEFTKFRRVCILAGCDYLPEGLPGVGLAKARIFFAKVSHPDIRRSLRRIPMYLNNRKLSVSSTWIESFLRAENTFLYQIVFDPLSRRQQPLRPYPLDEEGASPLGPASFPYAGLPNESEGKARELALGNLDPRSLERLDAFLPSQNVLILSPSKYFELDHGQNSWSIWSPEFRAGRPFSLAGDKADKAIPASAFQAVPVFRSHAAADRPKAAPAVPTPSSSQGARRRDSDIFRRSPRKPLAAAPTPERELENIYGVRLASSLPDLKTDEEPPSRRHISHYFSQTPKETGIPVSTPARAPFKRPRFVVPASEEAKPGLEKTEDVILAVNTDSISPTTSHETEIDLTSPEKSISASQKSENVEKPKASVFDRLKSFSYSPSKKRQSLTF